MVNNSFYCDYPIDEENRLGDIFFGMIGAHWHIMNFLEMLQPLIQLTELMLTVNLLLLL